MPKLNKQQEKLVRMRVKNPTASLNELSRKTAYTGGASSVCRVLNLPHVKVRIRELLESTPGLKLPSLMKKLTEGLNSKKKTYFQDKGNVVDEREDPDMPTRAKYLDTALELHGAKEKEHGSTVNNFFSLEALETFIDAFKSRTNRT